jgi:DinB superfamily
MRRLILAIFVLTLFRCSVFGNAQENSTAPPMVKLIDNHIKYLESELVPLVEAMPEKKFDFVPTKGEFTNVRTFAQQVTHLAADNYVVGAAVLRQQAPVAIGPMGFANPPKTKAETVKLLKDSIAYVHKAVASMNDQTAFQKVHSPYDPNGWTTDMSLVTGMLGHNWDHYGQLVVYLRMNGIIPPASQPKEKK